MSITREGLLAECQQQAAKRDQLLAQARELTAQAQACEGARVLAAKLLRQLDEADAAPAPAPEKTTSNGRGRTSRKPAEAVH